MKTPMKPFALFAALTMMLIHFAANALIAPVQAAGRFEVSSVDTHASFPAQLYSALKLVPSDDLYRTGDQVSLLADGLEVSCFEMNGITCRFLLRESELGWSAEILSPQATLYRALESLWNSSEKSEALEKQERSEGTLYRLADAESSSSIACIRQGPPGIGIAMVQFNCRIRIAP